MARLTILARFFRPAALAALLIFAAACGPEETWDPEVAALVDDRPIAKAAVDRVLEWGLYTRLGGDENENAAAIRRIIEAQINEELIAGEARKVGLTATEREVTALFNTFESSWFGRRPLAAEEAELRQALGRQIMSRKMIERIMAERRVLAPDEWNDFWDRWPKTRRPVYQARVLLLPPSEEAPVRPKLKEGGLDKLAEYFEKEGLAVLVSEPLRLPGDRLEPGLAEALAKAWAGEKLTEPYRQAESWAIYEVTAAEPGPTPDEQFKAAKSAFEAQAGEAAFIKWMQELRAQATIRINPAYLVTVDPETMSED